MNNKLENEKKRRVPRHVDGRIKIANILPIKKFFIVLPFDIVFIIIFFNIITRYTKPIVLLLLLPIGVFTLMFCEFQFGISGYSIIKDYIKFSTRGDIHSERRCNKNE